MSESKELGTRSIGALLLKFSVPAVIGMLVNALYSVVDRIFIGRGVGSLALSGVAITFPITNIIMGIGMLIGSGAAAVISIKLGQKKKEDAEKILGNAYFLTLIIPILLTIVGLIFLDPILRLFGASDATLPYAHQFASILLAGAILQNVGFGLNPIIRAQGDPKTAMITMLIGAVINFIANPIFIFGLHMGVAGSALATLLAQAVCSIWIFLYFWKGKSVLQLRRIHIRPDSRIIKEILAIGVSPFIMQIAASVVTILINTSLVQYGGDLAVGAYSLISSIAILIIMPILGVNQGVQPIIGYNYGAGNVPRVKRAFWLGFWVNTIIATLGWLFVELFPRQIISIFNKDDLQLIAIASEGLALYLLALFGVGPQSACVNFFQSIGKAFRSMSLSLLRQVVLLIPLILILPHFWGLNGVWFSGPISDFGSTVIALVFLLLEFHKLRNFPGNSSSQKI